MVRYDTDYLFYDFNNAHHHSVSALVAKKSKNELCQSLMQMQVRVRNLQLNVAANSARKQPHNVILSMFYLFIIYFILLIQETNTSRSQQARSAAWWTWISPGIRMVSGTLMLFCVLNSVADPDPYLWLTDPDPTPALDPALFVSTFKIATKNYFFANYFLRLHLHNLSEIKSHKVTKQAGIKDFLTIFAWLYHFRRIRSLIRNLYYWIRIRNQEGQKHTLRIPRIRLRIRNAGP